MTRTELATASDELEAAADATSGDADAADRLVDLAGQLDTLAERDRAPDHGRLARIENALGELRADLSGTAIEHIEAAEEHITAFRETIEGV
jgi:hypothetical protein